MSVKIVPIFEVPQDLSTLPAPPVPAGLDLRHFDCMHLDTYDLLDSPIWDESSDAGIATALRLWARSWQQVPCASLPNNDAIVRKWAGCEGKAKRWKSVQKDALRGFELCNDGRIYHHKVADMANRAAGKSRAGKRGASVKWEGHTPLKTKKARDATAYGNGHGRTDDTLYSSGDGRPDGRTDAEKGRDNLTSLPPSFSTPGSVGCADAPPDRAPTPRELGTNPRALGTNPRAEGTNPRAVGENPRALAEDAAAAEVQRPPEHVYAELPSGAKIKISEFGQVDVVWTPLDCEQVRLTRQQAMDIRAKVLADAELGEPRHAHA